MQIAPVYPSLMKIRVSRSPFGADGKAGTSAGALNKVRLAVMDLVCVILTLVFSLSVGSPKPANIQCTILSQCKCDFIPTTMLCSAECDSVMLLKRRK